MTMLRERQRSGRDQLHPLGMAHGTHARYAVYGCRCFACEFAETAWVRRYSRPQHVKPALCLTCGEDDPARFEHHKSLCSRCKSRAGKRRRLLAKALPLLDEPKCQSCGIRHKSAVDGTCAMCRIEQPRIQRKVAVGLLVVAEEAAA